MNDLSEIKEKLKSLELTEKQLNAHLKKIALLKEWGIEPEVFRTLGINGFWYVGLRFRHGARWVDFQFYKTTLTVFTTEEIGNRWISRGMSRYGSKDEIKHLLNWLLDN